MLGLLPLAGQFALAFIVLLSALKYPPFVLFIFLLFSFSDSYGVACAITPGYFGVLLDPLLLVASAAAFYGLWLKKDSSRPCSRMFNTATLMVLATLWIGLSVYANGSSMRQVLAAMSIKGPHSVIIVMAYWNDQRARKLFLAVVIIQLFLAFGSLLYPDGPFSIIQAYRYNDYAIDSNILEFRFERVSVQFLNSLQLGFYAGVGMIITFYLWRNSKNIFMRIVAVSLGLVAIAISYQTVSRGVWLAVLVCFLWLFFRNMKTVASQIVLIINFIAIIIAIPLLNSYFKIYENIDFFSLRFSQIDSSGYRAIALASFKNYFISNPFFGIGDVGDRYIFMPHILPLDFAVLYGFIPACLIAVLIYRSISKTFQFAIQKQQTNRNISQSQGLTEGNRNLAIMLGILSVIMAMTNSNAGRTLQFVCLGFSCIPWIMSEGKKRFSKAINQ